MFHTYLAEFLKVFFAFLIIMDPVGNIPSFLSVTSDKEPKIRAQILRSAIIIAGIVLLIFAVFGRFLLMFFGITPGAFYIAGGILVFIIGLEMIQSVPKRSRDTPDTSIDPHDTAMLAVFPLAIPLTAGPGLITTVMLYVTSKPMTLSYASLIVAALVLGLAVQYVCLRCSTIILRLIGTTGMFVLEKIMGLILSGMAIQLVYDGLVKLNILGN